MSAINNRYDFIMLFDVENGNPNGDPDAGNMPRVDAETNYGLVTDVCIKRKIRNFVELYKNGDDKNQILIKMDASLNAKNEATYKSLDLPKNPKGKNKNAVRVGQDYMCEHYFDVRTFGAVMSTGDFSCGKVTGPVQITFARSIDPVYTQQLTISRQAVTTDKDFELKDNELGKKNIIPYALYRAEGFVSASLAQSVTGFSEEDVQLLWTAIENMFESDRSAARGKMCLRKLIVFKHDSVMGNCPAQTLFDKVTIEKTAGVVYPRKYSDYQVKIDRNMPDGVTLLKA